jgi:hypothetical protein
MDERELAAVRIAIAAIYSQLTDEQKAKAKKDAMFSTGHAAVSDRAVEIMEWIDK